MSSRYNKLKQSGATLLEVVLVLVICAAIVILAIRQYESIKRDADVQQVRANVNKYFQAGSEYYFANCRNLWNNASGPVAATGTLDPANAPVNPFPVTDATLRTDGFLSDLIPETPPVNTGNAASPGYVVQFNLKLPAPDREMMISGQATPVKLGQIMFYTVQVAVLLRDTSLVEQYLALLGAECLSTGTVNVNGQFVVTPCNQVVTPITNTTGGSIYAVYERLPSFAMPNSNSDFWVSNPNVKEFNQLYQTKPVVYLTTVESADYPEQYYLCGG